MIRRVRVRSAPLLGGKQVWTGLGLPRLTRLASGFAGVRTQLLPSNHLDRALGGKSGDPPSHGLSPALASADGAIGEAPAAPSSNRTRILNTETS